MNGSFYTNIERQHIKAAASFHIYKRSSRDTAVNVEIDRGHKP